MAFLFSCLYLRIFSLHNIEYALLVGLSTIVVYTLAGLSALLEGGVKGQKFYLVSVGMLFLPVMAALSSFLSLWQWLSLGHLLVLCLCYVFPVLKVRLRNLPYLKAFIISYVWALAAVTAVLGSDVEFNQALLICIEAFAFIFSLCLLYDVKDIEQDRENRVKTFATELSLRQLKLLSLLIFGLSYWALCAASVFDELSLALYALGFVCVLLFLNKRSSEHYYRLGVDGMIGLKFFVLFSSQGMNDLSVFFQFH